MYRKTLERKQYERKVAKCAAMRAAKEWKRLAESEALIPSGWIRTGGCIGEHFIELLAYPDGKHLAVVVDGKHRQARTFRGLIRCMAEMINRIGERQELSKKIFNVESEKTPMFTLLKVKGK
jgi:hypothetical protein